MLLGSPKTADLLRAAEAATLRIDIVPGRIENDAVDIERVIAAIADKPNVAMAVLPDSTTSVNSDLIIALAARHEVFE